MAFLLVSGCALLLVVTASVTVNDTEYRSEKEINISREYKRTSSKASTRYRKPQRTTITRRHSLMLPQELIDEITEYLKDDKPTLKACALTHRMFLPRARKYLFRTLFVRRHGPDPYKLRTCPEVSRNFREVIIRGNLCSEVKHCSSFINYELVDTLRLEGSRTDWKEIDWSLRQSDIPALPALRNLSLSRVYFTHFKDMISTLESFPQLETLSLDFEDYRYSFAKPKELNDCELRLPVHTLHMRLNLVTPPGPVPNVVLNSAGDNLRDLSLNVMSTAPTKPAFIMMNHIDLSKNTSLESLSLRFAWHTSRPSWIMQHHDLPYIDLLLSSIYSSSLRSITFHFEFEQSEMNHPRWVKSLDLRFLDRLVHPDDFGLKGGDLERARVASRSLKEINIVLRFPNPLGLPASSRIVKHVRDQLPGLESRGMVHVIDPSQS